MTRSDLVRYLRDTAVFAPCYIALDWASYIAPLGPFNITPWNPQPALALAWMLLGGLRYAPAVLATIFVAELAVRHAPAGYAAALLTAAVLGAGYTGIAAALRALLRPDPLLRSTRQLTVFAGVVVLGAGALGFGYVGALRLANLLPGVPFAQAGVRFWIGDAVGILVTAPLFLVAADPERRSGLLALARRGEAWVQAAVLVGTVWLIFGGLEGDPARLFYVLFLPLIWIAARGGMNGAVLASALVQLAVVLEIHQRAAAALPVVELQALVAALTLTGLYLGMMVDERERTAESLRRSLRLAAAGEMAGAIAHEVNQPLTALANYARSAQLVIERAPDAPPQLAGIVERMLLEARRAAEVVRRLRDFFRTGTTRLETVAVGDLLGAARRIGEQLIGTRPIVLDIGDEAGLPELYVDRLQIELVLRNLLANAVEAVGGREGEARVAVHALERDGGRIDIVVTDSGPGVTAGGAERVFEPFHSGKPTGMGLGLAVSRAIAEAHGGSLEARAAAHGEFHLVLPCVT